MRELIMIRHGITEGIEKRWYYGKTDLPLSEAGYRMCAEEGKNWHLPKDVQFATTGMLRTKQTLEAMFGPHESLLIPEMREMDMGEFECKTYYDLVDNPAYQAWLSDAAGETRIPGGESNRQFRERVVQGLNRLIREPAQTIALVCHGGTICTVMFHLFPEVRENFFDWHCEPCHGYAVHFENEKPVDYEQV